MKLSTRNTAILHWNSVNAGSFVEPAPGAWLRLWFEHMPQFCRSHYHFSCGSDNESHSNDQFLSCALSQQLSRSIHSVYSSTRKGLKMPTYTTLSANEQWPVVSFGLATFQYMARCTVQSALPSRSPQWIFQERAPLAAQISLPDSVGRNAGK